MAEVKRCRSCGNKVALDEHDRRVVAKLYREGASLHLIAEKFEVSVCTIWRCLVKLGVERRATGRPKKDAPGGARVDQVLRLLQAGRTGTSIAKELGISHQAVYSISKRWGKGGA